MTINSKRYRLKSRSRFMLFITVIMILFVSMTYTALGVNDASSLTMQEYIGVYIEPGDTLWEIASEHMSEHMEIRKAVYVLCEVNNITADTLQPGQTIMVPVYI